MAFTPGIQKINLLAADLPTNTDVIPDDVTGFSVALAAGARIKWRVRGAFSTGATGGFRFLAHSTAAPTTYNAEFEVNDITTPATFNTALIAEAAFTNASAVATNYRLLAEGELTANAATTFSFQFAQNNSTANNITMRAGLTFEVWQF